LIGGRGSSCIQDMDVIDFDMFNGGFVMDGMKYSEIEANYLML